MEKIDAILKNQRTWFAQGKTQTVGARKEALAALRAVLKRHEPEIYEALKADLGKSPAESYMCELGLLYSELTWMEKHLPRLARPRTVPTPLSQFAARSFTLPCPRGTVLIMSPWNYPLLLTLSPLIDALAAGNTAVIKPSAYAPATSALVEKLVTEAFDPGLVAVVTGGRAENQQLLEQKFDFIFFTGSPAVGREVLRHAAPNLTPAVLELGGKSPCIVDETADLKLAARRIVFGKYLNLGQTCVAPDYLCCHESVVDPLLAEIRKEILRQFGEKPLENPDYGRIVNEKHFNRISGLMSGSPLYFGGETDPDTLQIAPTVLYPASWEDPVMQEEIFGPVLPVLTYRSLSDLLETINARPHPLALYFFSRNKQAIRHVTRICPFGGGCINDTVIHLATPHMGFGGVGSSGMGAYHGKTGFETFSHRKSIVDKKTWLDLPMRYQPYTEPYQKLVKFFLK